MTESVPGTGAAPKVLAVDGFIFDLDNTLVECLSYYVEAQHALRERLERAGVGWDTDTFLAHYRAVARPLFQSHGFGRTRFPITLRETARRALEACGRVAGEDLLCEAYDIGDAVFDAPYEPYAGALDTLRLLRERGYRLGLCTKGDTEVQRRKIDLHGIAELVDCVRIVPRKGAREILETRDALGCSGRRVAMVGDSLHDDIAGGRAAGVATVWVHGDPIHLTEAHGEVPDIEPDFRVEHVRQLPDLLPPSANPRKP